MRTSVARPEPFFDRTAFINANTVCRCFVDNDACRIAPVTSPLSMQARRWDTRIPQSSQVYSEPPDEVPAEFLSWETKFPLYAPIEFVDEAAYTNAMGTEEPCDESVAGLKFNAQDGRIDRTRAGNCEHTDGLFAVNSKNFPQNPRGRTGVIGRGALRRYGYVQHLLSSFLSCLARRRAPS